MPTSTTEADIIFNKASVALARSQRLIASWLPPRTAEELGNTKSEEEIEREEQEMFTPVPELLGLGAPLPKDIPDGDRRRQELSSNDKLRKQLLGKDFPKLQATVEKRKAGPGERQAFARPRPIPVKRQFEEDDEDDEGGRSSLGKSKRQTVKDGSADGGGEVDDETRPFGIVKSSPTRNGGGRKSASNYLDEVLAEKSRKKKRNKKQKKEIAKLKSP
ncbi:MAG: hypothetical protein M1830_008482 [Pleopsidium flavum]|nr:MAG: hypothetical protein M1830_008482 [Pleopsidium flavum]